MAVAVIAKETPTTVKRNKNAGDGEDEYSRSGGKDSMV